MSQSIEALENQYFVVRSSLSTLKEQGATDAQLNALRIQIAQSRANWQVAVNHSLEDGDPQISLLVTQLNVEQTNLNATIGYLNDISKVIDGITKAVSIGSQIVAKAVAL